MAKQDPTGQSGQSGQAGKPSQQELRKERERAQAAGDTARVAEIDRQLGESDR